MFPCLHDRNRHVTRPGTEGYAVAIDEILFPPTNGSKRPDVVEGYDVAIDEILFPPTN
jgi:hypothetical protein